jgi:hypothetical protein
MRWLVVGSCLFVACSFLIGCAEVMSCPTTERVREIKGDLTLVESKSTFEERQKQREQTRQELADAGVELPTGKAPERFSVRPGDVDTAAGFSPYLSVLACASELRPGQDRQGQCVAIGIAEWGSRYGVWLMFDLPKGPGTHHLSDLHATLCRDQTGPERSEGSRPCAAVDGELVVREVAPTCGYLDSCGRLDADLEVRRSDPVPDDPHAYGKAHLVYRNENVDRSCDGRGAPSMNPMR